MRGSQTGPARDATLAQECRAKALAAPADDDKGG